MAGALTPGYFPANYFTHRYWQLGNQYWTEYGTAAPAAVSRWPRRPADAPPPLPLPRPVLEALRDYLALKVS